MFLLLKPTRKSCGNYHKVQLTVPPSYRIHLNKMLVNISIFFPKMKNLVKDELETLFRSFFIRTIFFFKKKFQCILLSKIAPYRVIYNYTVQCKHYTLTKKKSYLSKLIFFVSEDRSSELQHLPISFIILVYKLTKILMEND